MNKVRELNSGNYLGTETSNHYVGGVWISLIKYDESLLANRQNFSNDWHIHQNPHLSLILEGGNIERRKNLSTERYPGNVCFYEAGEIHQNINVLYPSKNLNIEIDANFFSKYNLKENTIKPNSSSIARIKFAMLKIYKETFSINSADELAIHSLILNTVLAKKTVSNKSRQIPYWVSKVREVLCDRWNENLSLGKLSEISGVHPVTISKNFPVYFSCTLGEYVRRIRVERSLDLIRRTKNPLTDIAHHCGFADQSHFARVFKNLTGIQPQSFRKM